MPHRIMVCSRSAPEMNDGVGQSRKTPETPADIILKFKETPICLEALFTGSNPFDKPADVDRRKKVRRIRPMRLRHAFPF
jgi:hypothetical protein